MNAILIICAILLTAAATTYFLKDDEVNVIVIRGREMNMIEFTVYGEAKPKGSTRSFVVKGRAITTTNNPNAKEWQQLVSLAAQQHRPKGGPLRGAVELKTKFYFSRPRSVSEKKRPYPTVRPDLDKLVRNIGDALKGIMYAEDAQIVKIETEKGYGDVPRVDIKVKELGRGG